MACQQLRSTSLPVRPHALVQEVEDELQRIRSGASASAWASSPSLAGRLGDAYGRVEELVRLHGGRDASHALSGARWRGAVEAKLDASVALLDLCQRARDAVASAKQHVRAARRGDAALARAAVRGYVRCLAKAGKKHVDAGARKLRSKQQRAPASDAGETPAAVKVLSEAVAVTVAVLQCVLSSLSRRVADTRRKSRWCVVSKLLVGTSDWSLGLGVCKDLEGHEGAMSAQETLQELEDRVDAAESGLDHLFRHIVQTRVALLNVLTL